MHMQHAKQSIIIYEHMYVDHVDEKVDNLEENNINLLKQNLCDSLEVFTDFSLRIYRV